MEEQDNLQIIEFKMNELIKRKPDIINNYIKNNNDSILSSYQNQLADLTKEIIDENNIIISKTTYLQNKNNKLQKLNFFIDAENNEITANTSLYDNTKSYAYQYRKNVLFILLTFFLIGIILYLYRN
jgi:hypothetical protein